MMDSQVDEVKRRVDIVALINEYIPLKKSGRNYKALCPFHGEKTPSFMVSGDRQIFKCFGCGEGGDAFAFIKRMEGLEFGEALKILADRAGVKLKEYKVSSAELKKETLIKISESATELYHYLLTKHKAGSEARKYLKARNISDKSIKDFKLGWSGDGKNFLFQFLVKKGFSPPDINLAGLTLTSSEGVIDRFRSRVIFPIFDVQGRPVAFSGRSLGENQPKYLNSPETPLFEKSRALYGIDLAKTSIKKEKSAILVEGNLDVISSHQVGITNTIAPLGTALTEKQVEIIKRFAENLLFAFDTDLAGDAAAKRGIELAENAGLNIKVVHLSSGKDPDELIRKDPLAWKKSIKEAISVYDYFIDSAISRYGNQTAEGKRKVATEVLPQLAKLNDQILVGHYIQLLAAKLSIEAEDLRAAIKKYSPNSPTQDGKIDLKEILEKPPGSKAGELLETYLLALIIQSGESSSELDEKLFEKENLRQLYKVIKSFLEKESRVKVKKLISEIPSALMPTFDDLLLMEIDPEIINDSVKTSKEINYCVQRLKELNLRKQLKEISLAIKQAEASGNTDKIHSLTAQFRDLTKLLTSLGG